MIRDFMDSHPMAAAWIAFFGFPIFFGLIGAMTSEDLAFGLMAAFFVWAFFQSMKEG